MKESTRRLKQLLNAYDKEWLSTDDLKRKLNWFDKRNVYSCTNDLIALGFDVEIKEEELPNGFIVRYFRWDGKLRCGE